MFKRFSSRLKEPKHETYLPLDFEEAPVFLNSLQEVHHLQPAVKEMLAYEFTLGESASRLCPVLLADDTVAIFSVEEHSQGDAIEALAQRIQRRGLALARPARYVLSVALLLELIRDPLLNKTTMVATGSAAATPWSQADLFNAFLDIVRWGVEQRASDIHINVFTENEFSEVRFSISGRYICPLKFQGISTQFLHDVLSVAWMNIRGGNGAVFDPHKEQQGSLSCDIDGQNIMLRWGALAAEFGPSVCLRILRRDQEYALPTLAQLGYLPAQQRLLQQVSATDGGAIVFSGAVGSGKSTTLAALVAALPAWRKVISIEDPVEYLIPNAVQVSLSRDLNQDSHDAFATKLRALKRSAMSDVLLGEIRDLETGRAFTDLSSSGVRLYTTVHANSAALVPARLHSDFIGVSMDLLAAPGVLRLIVHQSLLPRLCQQCAKPLLGLRDFPAHIDRRLYTGLSFQGWLKILENLVGPVGVEQMRTRDAKGCEACDKAELDALRGWDGRVVCAELLDPSHIPQFLKNLKMPSMLQQVLHEAKWSDIRSSALQQARLGLLDPFEIEAHFAVFSAPAWRYVQVGEPHA